MRLIGFTYGLIEYVCGARLCASIATIMFGVLGNIIECELKCVLLPGVTRFRFDAPHVAIAEEETKNIKISVGQQITDNDSFNDAGSTILALIIFIVVLRKDIGITSRVTF